MDHLFWISHGVARNWELTHNFSGVSTRERDFNHAVELGISHKPISDPPKIWFVIHPICLGTNAGKLIIIFGDEAEKIWDSMRRFAFSREFCSCSCCLRSYFIPKTMKKALGAWKQPPLAWLGRVSYMIYMGMGQKLSILCGRNIYLQYQLFWGELKRGTR